MRRWASVVGRHGLLLLEVHSLTVSDTAQFMAEATSLHFDALQSWSGQMLVPAPHWQLALAHAGLLPDANLLCYPKDSLYTRITLQRLVPAPCAGFRLATFSDLPQLLELETQWDSVFLRSSEATLRQRLELEPSGQFVAFGGDGALLAAMYTQRVASLEELQHGPSIPAQATRLPTIREVHCLCSRPRPTGPERRALTPMPEREAAAALYSLPPRADFH